MSSHDGRDADLHSGEVRIDRSAVDPTGTRVAFGGRRLRVVDARVQHVIAEGPEVPGRDDLQDLVFASPDHVVSAGRDGGLRRWVLRDGGAVPEAEVDTELSVSSLFVVPAWGLVGGRVYGEGRHRYFHWESLAPADEPAPFADRHHGHTAAVIASPHGGFVAAGGHLLADAPPSEQSFDPVLFLHDLRHPLSYVQRPIGGLTATDFAELSHVLAGQPSMGLSPSHAVTDEERTVLQLIHDYASARQAGGPHASR